MSKKRILLIFVVITAVVIAGYFIFDWIFFKTFPIFPSPDPNNASLWETYRSEKMGFELKYPKKFDVVEGGAAEGTVSFRRTPYAYLNIFVNPNFGLEGTKKNRHKTYNIGGITTEADILVDDPIYNVPNPAKYIMANIKRGNNWFVFKLVFPTSDNESEKIFDQILSTFEFR